MTVRPCIALQSVAQYLPDALVGLAAARRIREIASALPDGAASVGFECGLGVETDAVDLGISIAPRNDGHSVLCGDRGDSQLARCTEVDESWQRLRFFAKRWVDPLSGLAARVPFLFLEFDSDGPRAPNPIPSVFAALDWPVDELTAEAREHQRAQGPDGNPGLRTAKDILHLFRGQPLAAQVEALLDRCFFDLPDPGVVLHVAAMLSRPGQGVRLSVQLPRRYASGYLKMLGWSGASQLERLLAAHAAHTDFASVTSWVQVDFDVGEFIGDRVGVTLRPRHGDGWWGLLDALVRARLCDPAKRDALFSWPGISVGPLSGERRLCVIEHYIAHLKMGFAVGQEPQVKAYFGVTAKRLLGSAA